MTVTPFLCTLPNSARVYGVFQGESKASLVFLHDRGADLDSVARLARMVAQRGWRTVAIDLPGHGLSDESPGATLTMPSLAALHAYMLGRAWGPLFIAAVGASCEIGLAWSRLSQVAGLALISPSRVEGSSGGLRIVIPTVLFVPHHHPETVQLAQDICASAGAYWLRVLVPTEETGSKLLQGPWLAQVNSHLVGFLYDALAVYERWAARRGGQVKGPEPEATADVSPS